MSLTLGHFEYQDGGFKDKCPECKERYDCGLGRDIYVPINLYLNIFQLFILT